MIDWKGRGGIQLGMKGVRSTETGRQTMRKIIGIVKESITVQDHAIEGEVSEAMITIVQKMMRADDIDVDRDPVHVRETAIGEDIEIDTGVTIIMRKITLSTNIETAHSTRRIDMIDHVVEIVAGAGAEADLHHTTGGESAIA